MARLNLLVRLQRPSAAAAFKRLIVTVWPWLHDHGVFAITDQRIAAAARLCTKIAGVRVVPSSVPHTP